jgi:uncharacterized Zn finger protein (UPF0148 family)
MKSFQCEGCGSTDFYDLDGYRICEHCGRKHIITKEDQRVKQSTIDLNEDVAMLLEKCKTEPERAKKFAQRILEIDPNNAEAKRILYGGQNRTQQESQISANKVLAIVFFSIVIIGVFLVAFMTCRF